MANLRQALSYAKNQQWHNKTDKAGAVLSAQSGRERELLPSPQLAPPQQSLARELAALKEDLRQLRNRLEAAEHSLAQLEDQFGQTCSELLELLQSIPGVGLRSARLLLAELGDFMRFPLCSQLGGLYRSHSHAS